MNWKLVEWYFPLLAKPETTNPKPMNTTTPMSAKTSMLITVTAPLINVKIKGKMTNNDNKQCTQQSKTYTGNSFAKHILERLTGVAKKRLITKFCRRAKKINAVHKNAGTKQRKTELAWQIKSMVRYSLPVTVVARTSVTVGFWFTVLSFPTTSFNTDFNTLPLVSDAEVYSHIGVIGGQSVWIFFDANYCIISSFF